MKYPFYLKSYLVKHAFNVALAVAVAVIINANFAFSHAGWIMLAAFLTGHTTRGTPLRQAVIYSIITIIAILMASFLNININPFVMICVAAVVFMMSAYIVFINQPMQNKLALLVMLFAFILLIAIFSPVISFALRDQIIDVLIGAGIGIVCGQFVWRVRIEKDFQQGLMPVLQSSLQYAQVVTSYFIRRENDLNLLNEKRRILEKSLQTQYGMYPEWVYEAGFNPGLRSGFRFYLISIERMVEMLLSMDYLAHQGVSIDLITKISDLIFISMQKNVELMSVLLGYFEDNQLRDISANFTSDITELENATSRIVPGHLELLDISPDYITLTAFIRDVKDLRKLLLQLVMALPTNAKT